MRKKFNIDKIVFVVLIIFVIGIFLMPLFGENLKEFEKRRAKSNLEYKYPVVEKNGWYSSEHCRFSVEEWDDLYLKYSGYTEVSEFLHNVDVHVDAISEFLGVNNLGENIITFSLDAEGYGYVDTKDNLIEYSSYYFLNDVHTAPITREVYQLVVGDSTSAGLTEGLNFYVEQYINKAVGGNNITQDIICRSKIDMNEENSDMLIYVGKDGEFVGANEDGVPYLNRQVYALYVFNRSFSRYLIDEYGLDKFLELYFSKDIDLQYNAIYGKNIETLKEDWIKYVDKRYQEVYGK